MPVPIAIHQTARGTSPSGTQTGNRHAAVIGGTSLAGGRGGILGTVVGTLALGILSNLLGLNNVDENMQWMLKAIIIVAAVWLQTVGTKKDTLA